jgi:hypothetical protein
VTAARQPNQAEAHYSLALAQSYWPRSHWNCETRPGQEPAEAGIKSAERATALRPDLSEYQRVLAPYAGGHPANVLSGLRYGKCAQDA